MKTTLLTLTDDGLRACVWRRGAMTPLQLLPDAAALARLTAVEKILLLVDVTEEDFRVEAVPPLPKAEQIALAHRRLTTLHGGTPFRRTVRLHRRDRREDVMSCSALTRPEQITPWLDALRHAPLAGIHSAATVSAALIRRIAGDHALLLSWEKHAGLRLSFFAHKHLHFSRLVPCRTIFPSAETLAEEAKRTRQYLIDTGLLAAERTPALCLLCNAAHRAEIETHDDTPYVFLDLDEHARRAGLKTRSTDSDATPLL
ncbi:MAG: hypothetical protein LBE50_02920, partial [Gallionellaceae bacterium]|nr:hypothetical protein [Gallionellaceae bacterium]